MSETVEDYPHEVFSEELDSWVDATLVDLLESDPIMPTLEHGGRGGKRAGAGRHRVSMTNAKRSKRYQLAKEKTKDLEEQSVVLSEGQVLRVEDGKYVVKESRVVT